MSNGIIAPDLLKVLPTAEAIVADRGYDSQYVRKQVEAKGAMVAGSTPLLFSTGAGAAARLSIGIVMVAGLSLGTLFTLFVLPVIYSLMASQHQPLPELIEGSSSNG